MKVSLVSSPFTLPVTPLGISCLKSYVEKNSEHKVKCHDFNLEWHNNLINSVKEGKTKIKLHSKEVFLQAVDMFKQGNDAFFNQKKYDSNSDIFLKQLNVVHNVFSKECEVCLAKGTPVPRFMKKYMDFLLAENPDVIGFSILFKKQIYFSILLAKIVKIMRKDIKIVFGGSSLSKEIIEAMLKTPYVDYVVSGEGELPFLKLLDAIKDNKGVKEVPSLMFLKDDKIVENKPEVCMDLDSFPFADFSDFKLDEYYTSEPVVYVLTSRGCYWRKCTFCVHHSIYQNTYRVRSVENVVDELEHHNKNGVKYFYLVDEMIPSVRFKKIGEEILRRGLDINYYALAKPTKDFTKDVLDVMYKSGCRYIIWGVESGCQKIIDLMDKGTKVEDMGVVLDTSAKAGIKNHLFIIIGFPSETNEDLNKTLEFLYNHKDSIHSIHKSKFSLQSGSMIHECPNKFGIKNIKHLGSKCIGYDVKEGIQHKDLNAYIPHYSLNFFDYLTFFSKHLHNLRDQALILYSNTDKLVMNIEKKEVPLPKDVPKPELESDEGVSFSVSYS